MSIEIVLYPKRTSKGDLTEALIDLDFQRSGNVMPWPSDSEHFFWYQPEEFVSFEGVEATVYRPSAFGESDQPECKWAVHTRTRAWASSGDQYKQNETIRAVRKRFGGSFYNDAAGTNRYTVIEDDPRGPIERGVYLVALFIFERLRMLEYALPEEWEPPETTLDELAELIAENSPSRLVFNALIPFLVATIEYFFGEVFRVLLSHDPDAQQRLTKQVRKVEFSDLLAATRGERSVEDVVASWYSFQNLNSAHKAFQEWFDIDLRGTLYRRRKVKDRLPILDKKLREVITLRHSVIHDFQTVPGMTRDEFDGLVDLVRAVIQEVTAAIEKRYGTKVLIGPFPLP